MLRKIMLLTLTILMLSLLAGCGIKEKIGESITEGILDKALGDDADIDLDGDEITFTGEDGEVTTMDDNGLTFKGEDGEVVSAGGVYEWPEGQAADVLPKCKIGKITYVMNSDSSFMVMIEEAKREDYTDYVDKIKDEGFTDDAADSNADGMSIYSGNKDNNKATVMYADEEKTLQIIVEITESN